MKFLDRLDREVFAELEVHLILRWLLRHPRFVPHLVPKGASRLDLVERWFAEITGKLLRGVHRSVAERASDIRDWLDRWNQNPRPCVRVVETADETLTDLALEHERVSAARGATASARSRRIG